MIKLSDYVMKFLVAKGVSQVFMLPGGGAMHLDDSLGRCEDLKYVCFLHEQALAVAVESYGQYTNVPGVGLVTSGPGSTNTITGVAAAYIDSTPCFFLSGQAKRSDLKGDSGVRQMGSQEVDIVSMVSCITKYAVTVMEPEEIRYHLEKAWYEATTGRKGPVWLNIPLDVQAAMVDEDKMQVFSPEKPKISQQLSVQVEECIKLLNQAKCPLILVGNGVKLSGVEEEMVRFAEKNQIPMLLTWKIVDLLDFNHPLNFGSPGIMGTRYSNFIVQNCDLLLIAGSRLDTSITAFNAAEFGKRAKKIMVDIDQAEIRKIKTIDLPIVADMRVFLDLLGEKQSQIKQEDRKEWLSYCRRLKEKYPVVIDEFRHSPGGVNVYYFTELLFEQLKADDIITPESSGAAGEVTYQAMRIKKGQKVKNAAGLGSMGFGLPYSIGACLANNKRRTILINGDGAFQLNIQELETIRRLSLPIKMFILDNSGYGSIMATQRNMFGGFYVGSESGSGLTLPDVGAVARTYNLRYEQIEKHEELKDVIAKTLAGNDPVICRIKVIPGHVINPKVQAMKLPDGGMVSKPLEDMWPYLPPEELEGNNYPMTHSKSK